MSSSPSSNNKAAAMTTAAATCGRSTKYKCLRSYPLLLPNNHSDSNSNSNNAPPTTLRLTVAQGSVVDFRNKYGAIVNAANEGCLGGGGVDGAISNAGGRQLALDREALPIVSVVQQQFGQRRYIRCPTGHAKLTGPAMVVASSSTRVSTTTNSGQDPDDGDSTVESDHDSSSSSSIATYGALGVPYVIHAVGPNYMHFDEENDVDTPNRLLRSAYQKSLDCCKLLTQTNTTTRPTTTTTSDKQQQPPIRAVGFSLLSAGIFRGDQTLSSVLGIGVEALRDWARDHDNNNNNNNNNKEEEKDAASNQQQQQQQQQHQLEEIILFAFTDREAKTLLRVCDWILLGNKPETKSKESSSNSFASRKMDPPGKKVERNNDSETTNSDTSAATSSEENRKTVEEASTAAAETKGTVPDDSLKKNTEKPDPEAGQSTQDKVMTDVEDSDPFSGAEESIAKSSSVPPPEDTVQDNTTKEDKAMTDTEEEAANMIAKDQSSTTEMKHADETQKTTTTTTIISEDKVMTDVESFEDSSELPESETSSNKGETATCTAGGDEKAMDAAGTTDQKESN